MIDALLTWIFFGVAVGILARYIYIYSPRYNFFTASLLGTMGAASGNAMSNFFVKTNLASAYVSPIIYMLAGAFLIISLTLSNKLAR